MMKALLAFFFLMTTAVAQDIPNHSMPIGRGPGVAGFGSVGPCASGSPMWSSITTDPACGGVDAVNAKDFGAVGNGSTDDTTALQNWINSCQSGSRFCYLPTGNYKISSELSITSGITLFGQGRSNTFIIPSNATQNTFNITTNENQGVIKDIQIAPSVTKTGGSSISITANTPANNSWQFTRLQLGGDWNSITVLQNVNTISVTDSVLVCVNRCLNINGITAAVDSFFSNNFFGSTGSTGVAVYIKNIQGQKFVDNKVNSGNGLVGFQLDFDNGCNFCGDLLLANNSIEGINQANGAGILISGTPLNSTANIILTGNQIVAGGTNSHGISIIATGITRSTIVGNSIYSDIADGIHFGAAVNSDQITISNNVVTAKAGPSGGTGILTTAGITNCALVSNSIKNFITPITDNANCSAQKISATSTSAFCVTASDGTSNRLCVTGTGNSVDMAAPSIRSDGTSLVLNPSNGGTLWLVLDVTGTIIALAPITLSNATDSSSTSTGAFTTTGGMGIAKKLFVGDKVSSVGLLTAGSARTGNTGTCNVGVTVTGGASAGTWTSTAVCAIAGTIIISGMPAATTGYSCDASDRTTTGVVLQQTATSTTSVTFTVRTTATVANDIINFKCIGY